MMKLLDWRLWLAWAFAMLATASLVALFAMVNVVQKVQNKLDGRSQQSICLSQIQGDFDQHIATLLVASGDKDIAVINEEQASLRDISERFSHLERECPIP